MNVASFPDTLNFPSSVPSNEGRVVSTEPCNSMINHSDVPDLSSLKQKGTRYPLLSIIHQALYIPLFWGVRTLLYESVLLNQTENSPCVEVSQTYMDPLASKFVIIDTDPGLDDAMAIFLSFAKKLNVIGLTIVHGNLGGVAGLKQLGKNAARLLTMLNEKEVPVYLGESHPLDREEHPGASFVHGNDGMGDVDLAQEYEGIKIKTGASEWIVEEVMKREKDSVIIISLGPLTNLGRALRIQPMIADRVFALHTMGGKMGECCF